MKQNLLKTCLVMLLAVLGWGNAWAEADYTLTPSGGSNNSYTGNCDVTVAGITWNVSGNAQQIPWRLGGKSITCVDRTVYSKTAYTNAVKKIDLTVGAASSITVNSLKLVYSTNADFSNSSEISKTFAASSTISFEGDFPANAYYKFVFNVTVSGTSNKFVEFSKVEFYNATGGSTPEPTTYNVTVAENITGGTVTANPTSAAEGSTITLTATPATGYEFGAWAVKDASNNTITVTDNAFKMPAANVTVSATFNATEAPDPNAKTVTWVASEQEYTNGTQYTSAKVDSNISLAFGDGSNDGKYYDTGTGIRIYANGKVTVTAKDGCTMSKIVLTYSHSDYTGKFSASTGDYNLSETTGTWKGTASSVVLTNTATSGHARIQSIAVTYVGEGTPDPEPTYYTVTIAEEIANGTVTATPTSAKEGDTVTLTATPSEGYELDTWSVKGADNNTISVTNNKFTMPAQDVTVSATFKEKMDYTVLPFAWEGGEKAGLIALNGVTANGLGSDYAESHGAYRVKFDDDGDYIQVKTKEAIGFCTIGVKMIGGTKASAIKVQESTNGTEFTDVETLDITGATNTILTLTTSKALNSDSRYVRFVFQRGSNVGVGPISIVKPEMGGTINFVAENEEGYWATFSSDRDVIFPETDVIVYTVAYDGEDLHIYDTCCTSKGAITDKTADAGWDAGWAYGYYVQANTGVLVYCDETSAKYYFVENNEENDLYEINNAPANNQLRPASAAMTGDFNFYKLAYNDYEAKTGLGFYWGAENGAAFTCKAGTAYLAFPKISASNLRGFSLEGNGCTTGIESIVAGKTDAAIYNLQGQRVVRLQQGVNIVNGKKVIR